MRDPWPALPVDSPARPFGSHSVPLHLPDPMPHQLPILLSDSRQKVVVCGRRWGKSTLGLLACIEGHGGAGRFRGALDGGAIWWVAPSYPVASAIWRDLKHALRDGWAEKSETERRIVLPGGGSVSVRSADNPDSLRSVGLDGIVIDEFASCPEETWGEALRPTLADRQGWCIFIGTPKGEGWAKDLFDRADDAEGWARWQRPTADNPLIPAAEIEAARRDVGPLEFAQEYLAEFVTAGAGMFRREWFAHYRREGEGDDERYILPGKIEVKREDLRVFTCVDLAASVKTTADYTVFATFGLTPGGITLVLDVVRDRIEGPDIVPRLRKVARVWSPCGVWIEQSGFQLSVVQEARRVGLPVRALVPHKDKVARALPLTAALEGGRMLFRRSASWYRALESEVLAFPVGAHDDMVDTLAYATVAAHSLRTRAKAAEKPLRLGPIGGWQEENDRTLKRIERRTQRAAAGKKLRDSTGLF